MLVIRFANDESFGNFPGLLVWFANYGSVSHGGMLKQKRFKFGWGDAKAFVLDQLFFSVLQKDVALSIDEADVASVKPAVAQGAGRRFGGFPIPLHDLWTPNADLPNLTGDEMAT